MIFHIPVTFIYITIDQSSLPVKFKHIISYSCVPAEPSVNDSTKNAACIFYKYIKRPGGLCNDIITSLYVSGNKSTLVYGERETTTFQSYFNFFEITDKCKPIMRDLFCRYHFPPCDTTLEKPRTRRICRRSCEHLDFVLCPKEMDFIRNAAKTAPTFDHDMINCSTYDVANGGDAPECYQYQPLQGKSIYSYYRRVGAFGTILAPNC